ncbi:hypothetical protein AMAG_02026 [Allomyces macrogynus ATCC 38327]|uniref:Uncharacterized protein n=1 Tax=Allomyces macrogynus (strain ATCC 38327) TaxID=578462 RepID=A0A0L0S0Q2_ALLM3|nr:hypothetical protein AMAG_02026 [Allomyces macrogynus ATCC 38327]|eukprot:KNE56192.1 hypothetical protein AMAG_02026 [Allomyces macrogynus ATCC 38327]
MSAAIRDLAHADLQVLQAELAALRPQSTVYRRAVGNSNLLFLTPRVAVQKEVDNVLDGTLTTNGEPPFTTTSMPTSQPSPAATAPSSSATSTRPPQSQSETPVTSRQGARTLSSSKGGAAKGKGKGKRKGK